jgi:DNA recombination protein RmuC
MLYFYFNIILSLYAVTLTIVFLKSLKNYQKNILENSINTQQKYHLLSENQEIKSHLENLETENKNLISIKGEFTQMQIRYKEIKNELEKKNNENSQLKQQFQDISNQRDIIEDRRKSLEQESKGWEEQKSEIINKLSVDILKLNQDSQQQINEKQKSEISQITSDLLKKFEKVDQKVKSMNDDLEKSAADIDVTKNALLNPGSAGRMSELTLENILKASGLKERKDLSDDGDFILQPYIVGENQSGKRPDAMVFLPKDQILIIDSKSSSHFLQLQQNYQNGDNSSKKILLQKIKERIKMHISDLKRKDYSSHKIQEIGLNNWLEKDLTKLKIMTVMFLQTEGILSLIREIDPEIEYEALQAGIPILSPIGLINLLSQSKIMIYNSKQENNIFKLREEIQKLVASIVTIFTKSENLGKSLNRSVQTYDEFVGCFNKSFLSRIKNINSLGAIDLNQGEIKKLKKINNDEF